MHLAMFDIDGTLVESLDQDADCFVSAVRDELGIEVDTRWHRYTHVTDSGILRQVIDESGTEVFDDSMEQAVKRRFLQYIATRLEAAPVRQIPGAADFLGYLATRADVRVSLATGGWLESAKLKLTSAGIDIRDLTICSSSDHYSRTQIMRMSEQSHQGVSFDSKTYFGDGAWDRAASSELGYRFILLGNALKWHPAIENYLDIPAIMEHIISCKSTTHD